MFQMKRSSICASPMVSQLITLSCMKDSLIPRTRYILGPLGLLTWSYKKAWPSTTIIGLKVPSLETKAGASLSFTQVRINSAATVWARAQPALPMAMENFVPIWRLLELKCLCLLTALRIFFRKVPVFVGPSKQNPNFGGLSPTY